MSYMVQSLKVIRLESAASIQKETEYTHIEFISNFCIRFQLPVERSVSVIPN